MSRKSLEKSRSQLIAPSLVILAAVALGGALYFMRPVLVPLVLAILISYLVAPIVNLVQLRLKVPRTLAVIAALFIAAGFISLVVLMLSSSTLGRVAEAIGLGPGP